MRENFLGHFVETIVTKQGAGSPFDSLLPETGIKLPFMFPIKSLKGTPGAGHSGFLSFSAHPHPTKMPLFEEQRNSSFDPLWSHCHLCWQRIFFCDLSLRMASGEPWVKYNCFCGDCSVQLSLEGPPLQQAPPSSKEFLWWLSPACLGVHHVLLSPQLLSCSWLSIATDAVGPLPTVCFRPGGHILALCTASGLKHLLH